MFSAILGILVVFALVKLLWEMCRLWVTSRSSVSISTHRATTAIQAITVIEAIRRGTSMRLPILESDYSDSGASSSSDLVGTISRFSYQIFDSLEIGVQLVFWTLFAMTLAMFIYQWWFRPVRCEYMFMIRGVVQKIRGETLMRSREP